MYLLFNEGYGASHWRNIDTQRIVPGGHATRQLIQEKKETYALLLLTQLNASRFEARQDQLGNILTLDRQNRRLWDRELVHQGFENLQRSLHESKFTTYNIFASISAIHCAAKDIESTNWKSILALYDKLMREL